MKTVTVEEEYAKNPNITKDDVKYLMDWAEKQPHLPKITELDIIFFLSCYSASIEQAKTLIESYYTTRTHLPEYFSQRHPKSLKKDLETVLFHHLETKTPAKVFYVVLMDLNSENFSLNEQIKILGMVFDVWQLQEGTCDTYEVIADMKGVQIGHVAKLSIVAIKKAIHIMQEALQVQIKYIHVINVITYTDHILALIRPFMKKELMDKIIVHDGIESLFKYVPQLVLPQHLGGKGPTLKDAHDQMKRNLLENEEYFQEEETTKRVDESKRVGKPKNSSDLFGIEGSFKKLDID